jgi:hypothetical protein
MEKNDASRFSITSLRGVSRECSKQFPPLPEHYRSSASEETDRNVEPAGFEKGLAVALRARPRTRGA